MNAALTTALIVVLIAIAGLHLYWGLGGFWPGHDNDSLVGMVVGLPPGASMPPFWACLAVAACLLVPATSSAIIGFGWLNPLPRLLAWMPVAALWASAFVFIARGAATYSWVFDNTKGLPFYELNRLYYSPLCLALGVGLVMVWFSRPQT
jgi:Protein of unknown function (DUF3995)